MQILSVLLLQGEKPPEFVAGAGGGGCCSRQCQWSGLDSVCHRTASGKELSLWLDPACHSTPSYEEPGAQALKPLAITLTSRLSLFVCVYLGLKLCFRIWCFFLGWFPLLFHVTIQLSEDKHRVPPPPPKQGLHLTFWVREFWTQNFLHGLTQA